MAKTGDIVYLVEMGNIDCLCNVAGFLKFQFTFNQEEPYDLFLLATGQLFATLEQAMNYAQKINKKIIKIEKRYVYNN